MANKPRIRFRGFTEDWEQRKLDDIAKIKTGGGTPKTANPEYWSGNIPWIQSSDLAEGDIVHVNINKFINNNALKNSAAKLISRDSIALVTRVGVGKVAVINQDFTTSQDFLSLSDFDGSDIKFLAYQLYRLMQENAKVLQGTSIKGITKTELIEQSISIPSSGQEQNLISAVLSKIDSIITLHQCKLKKLNLAKKSLLQKLFPRNGSQIPGVRFKGFTDAWEQRKLCQITTRVTRKNGDQSDLPLTISAQDGLVDQRKYFNRQVASRDMSNYYLIKKGEFAYNKSYSEGYPFGAVKRLDYYDIGALSTLYILFEITDNNISSDFIVSYYMTHLWYKEISKRAAEGARNHGLLNISTEDFFDSELNIPNSIEEQVKIGNFIKQFDKFITLHQRKLERLQEVKKGLLQKMFV
ncbi:MAG: restriction endonuclease subunit S [Veillonella sp.]|uniref:restriction endonuclease subunit S n=1 Tax=Veillonella sp. TaxID=1926307 RepID=UPI00290AFEF1|nr:restriction endonuclease subunit S [Veillonella sp.]MDU7910747.1 restriction endonuclease subunit S [Veillonella parvula]MDU7927162.1 restriction endonuclease subunit S [Veillonella sp.]MDU8007481.1 restriction endonuclease subunit S [Veillonella sp.]